MSSTHPATSRRDARIPAIAAVLATVLLCAPAAFADFDQHVSLQGGSLLVANLAGTITVKGHAGSSFEVDVAVRGKDGTRETVQIESTEGAQAKLIVRFPSDRGERFVYPPMGHNSNVRMGFDRGDDEHAPWLREVFGGDRPRRLRVSGDGSGVEAWADVTLLVPRGAQVTAGLVVGTITAATVEGDLELITMSGEIFAQDVVGGLLADTGSGDVEVARVKGDVKIDTGSGDVEVSTVTGGLEVDTGSGEVNLTDVDAPRLRIDTGSGDVDARGVQTDGARIDTGSGDVAVQLLRMGKGRYDIDTGSGAITLRLPQDASALVEAATGSGGIRVDLEGAKLHRLDEDQAEIEIGSGDARVMLDTGSGRIRISR